MLKPNFYKYSTKNYCSYPDSTVGAMQGGARNAQGAMRGGAPNAQNPTAGATLTAAERALRRRIFASFAATGEPPIMSDEPALRGLEAKHVVVLDSDHRIVMAHPSAAHRDGARVDCDERTWWGNCAWDALGIVAALGLADARVASNAIVLDAVPGGLIGEAVFHVSLPARDWWEDIACT
jgi:Alkylmercury lyase